MRPRRLWASHTSLSRLQNQKFNSRYRLPPSLVPRPRFTKARLEAGFPEGLLSFDCALRNVFSRWTSKQPLLKRLQHFMFDAKRWQNFKKGSRPCWKSHKFQSHYFLDMFWPPFRDSKDVSDHQIHQRDRGQEDKGNEVENGDRPSMAVSIIK